MLRAYRDRCRQLLRRIMSPVHSVEIDSKPACVTANEPEEEYMPRAGQRGQHVEWVPCSPVVLDRMLEIAELTSEDYLIDPGSGDGRIVIRAAGLGARAVGVEFNQKLVELAQQEAEKQGVSNRASFVVGDFFQFDYSPATVVTLFLRKDLNVALREKILALEPGTRVVSNIFDMGDWCADKSINVEDENYYFRNHTVHLWIIPARVEGTWKLPDGELRLTQKYQMVEGFLVNGSLSLIVTGRILGDRISMVIDGVTYECRVSASRMDLVSGGENNMQWSALRS